jgi:hypothetical protein
MDEYRNQTPRTATRGGTGRSREEWAGAQKSTKREECDERLRRNEWRRCDDRGKSLFLFTAQLLRKMNLAKIFSKARSETITHKNKKRIMAATQNTRCAWAGGTCANYPNFFENHQFHVIYCFTLAYVLFSKNFRFTIHVVDSWFWRMIDRICWACAIFRWIPNLQVCTDRRTDGWTDGRTDGRTDGQTDELSRLSWVTNLIPPSSWSIHHLPALIYGFSGGK